MSAAIAWVADHKINPVVSIPGNFILTARLLKDRFAPANSIAIAAPQAAGSQIPRNSPHAPKANGEEFSTFGENFANDGPATFDDWRRSALSWVENSSLNGHF